MTIPGRQKLVMYNSSNARGPTISSLINTPNSQHNSSQPSSMLSVSFTTPVAPLSTAAIRNSKDTKLFAKCFPAFKKADRFVFVNWFLEEEKLKKYETFKSMFYEEPDDYTVALSSLLGTFIWDVSAGSSVGTFIAPNLNRRNQLLPFQAQLSEKWRVLSAAFTWSWSHVLGTAQRESIIMRSLIDTANVNENMETTRRQSFDLRTSELSGKGFISFIQEHCLGNQNNNLQQGAQISLPQTENMSRVFKEWIDSTNLPYPLETKDEHLFRRSCALSLRDMCIYSRAIFGTRLCLTVLEKWEQAVRPTETDSRAAIVGPIDNVDPITTETEVEVPDSRLPTISKNKKKKKGKQAKKGRKATASERVEEDITGLDENQAKPDDSEVQQLEIQEGDFSDDDATVVSCTDSSKSSGLSSPTGTCSESVQSSSTTKPIPKRKKKNHHNRKSEFKSDNLTVIDLQKGLGNEGKESRATMELKHVGTGNNKPTNSSIPAHEPAKISKLDSSATQQIPTGGLQRGMNETPREMNEAKSVSEQQIHPQKEIQVMDELTHGTDSEWSQVMGKKKKNVILEASRNGSNQQNGPKRGQTSYSDNIGNRRPGYGAQHTRWQPNVNTNGSSQPNGQKHFHHNRQTELVPQRSKSTAQVTSGPSIVVKNSSDKGVDTSSDMLEIRVDQVQAPPDSQQNNANPVLPSTDPNQSSGRGNISKSINGTVTLGIVTNVCESDTPTQDIQPPRKGSLADSETTEVSTTSSRTQKPRKKKTQKKKKPTGERAEVIAVSAADDMLEEESFLEPISLDKITFNCAHCRRPRAHDNSKQCAMCGPLSTIRYCSYICQKEDTDHWRLCGLCSIPYPVEMPENSEPVRYNHRSRTEWMSSALVRQGNILAENLSADYVLFDYRTNLVAHKISFDGQTSAKFTMARETAFQYQDQKVVVLMHKVIMLYVQSNGIRFSSDDLGRQLYDEFAVTTPVLQSPEDLSISPQEWINAGVRV